MAWKLIMNEARILYFVFITVSVPKLNSVTDTVIIFVPDTSL